MVNISSVDLNLLLVFRSLNAELSATGAARRLNLSQPAVSHALARLREIFSDPLFVRASRGLVATRRATELSGPVNDIISKIEILVNARSRFDPLTEKREFRISTTDYFELVALPTLLNRLETEAPNIRLVCRPTSGSLPKANLESGEVDLAVAGLYGDLPEGYFQQLVFRDQFVCVGRKGHRRLKGTLSLKKYADSSHILISPDGNMKSKSAQILKRQGYEQKFSVGTHSFLSPGWIACSTDLLLTCPKMLARAYERYLPVEIQSLPFDLGQISVVQVWHARHDSDPAHAWIRSVIKEVCATLR